MSPWLKDLGLFEAKCERERECHDNAPQGISGKIARDPPFERSKCVLSEDETSVVVHDPR